MATKRLMLSHEGVHAFDGHSTLCGPFSANLFLQICFMQGHPNKSHIIFTEVGGEALGLGIRDAALDALKAHMRSGQA